MPDSTTTAATALQQAFSQSQNTLGGGDVEAPEKGGQTDPSIKMVPETTDQSTEQTEEKDTAVTSNKEAKSKRISDDEWQKTQEALVKSQDAAEKLARIEAAFTNAPKEVAQEEDLAVKVQRLTEMNERKDWEAEHPIVKKYADEWKEVVGKKGHLVRSGDLTYDDLLRLISRESPRVKEEWKAYESNATVSAPVISKSTVSQGTESDQIAADFLRKAGFGQKAIDQGLKL